MAPGGEGASGRPAPVSRGPAVAAPPVRKFYGEDHGPCSTASTRPRRIARPARGELAPAPYSRSDGALAVWLSPSTDSGGWRASSITVVNIRLSALRLPRALRWLYKNQAHLSFAHRPFLPPCIYAITRPSRLTGPFFPGETALERSAAHTLGLLLSNEALESYSQLYD